MWERIILAAITTFCIYLFLNLSNESSTKPSFQVNNEAISEFVQRVASFASY
jgi:hypothetical protein